jgi:general stress protein 26
MGDDGEAPWQHIELGNDEEAWEWAIDKVQMHATLALATHDEGGPRVRPVTAVPHGGEVYVLTGTKDAKVAQLAHDPRFEFYVLVKEGDSTGYVRFQGTARPVEDASLRRELCDASGFADEYFDGPGDPNLALLHMDISAAEVMRPGMKGYEMLTR